jgi:hypothetical protein
LRESRTGALEQVTVPAHVEDGELVGAAVDREEVPTPASSPATSSLPDAARS